MKSKARSKSRHWLVYILRCRDGTFYTGITNDLATRLQAHQEGKASRYTRSRLPVKLIYLESAADRSAATRRELIIKRMKRTRKKKLIISSIDEPTKKTKPARKKREKIAMGMVLYY